jgi:hypothetical protein
MTGKKGVKTVLGNFSVHPTGTFKNTDNDKFLLYGNFINYGTCNMGTGKFELLGTNKNIEGSLSCNRLKIDGTYTNTCLKATPLEIKTEFDGTGTLIQSENSYLIIKTTNSPFINASAIGNTVIYTGTLQQTANASEFYNLILANTGKSILLNQNCIISQSLAFEKACFLDCNTQTLTFKNWHELMVLTSITPDRSIIVNKGKIVVTQVDSSETAILPISHSATLEGFARIDITNFDKNNTQFTIDSLINQTTSTGISNSGTIYSSFFVKCMYQISSLSTLAKLTIYWHTAQELPFTERDFCSMLHHNGNNWEVMNNQTIASKIPMYNIYSISATTSSFSPFTIGSANTLLPITLAYFQIGQQEQCIYIEWQTQSEENNDYFTIQKSYNGIDFFTINTIQGKTNSNTPILYSYTDNETETGIIYYKLMQTDLNGTETTYNIESIDVSNYQIIIKKNEQEKYFEVITTNQTSSKIEVYTINMEKILESTASQKISYRQLPKGFYFITIESDKGKVFRKIVF